MRSASRVDWAEILAAARGIPELFEIVAQLAVGEVLLRSGALARIGSFEVQLVGQPPTVQVLIEGIFAPGQGVAGTPLQVGERSLRPEPCRGANHPGADGLTRPGATIH